MLFFLSLLTILNFNGTKIKVEKAWLIPADKGMNSAMYFNIVNNSDEADTLYKVTSNAAQLVQMHKTFTKNGLTGMQRIKYVVVKPHSTFKFKPGGYHVMFMILKKDFKVKTKHEATFYFKDGTKIKVDAVVKAE